MEALCELLEAFLSYIPFENLSKLLNLKRHSLKTIPPPELYISGIEENHFGGTCYSNNYYFSRLLCFLGYDTRLCGAAMSAPDVHTVIIVDLSGRSYLIDVGYAAPLLTPLPLEEDHDMIVERGPDVYCLHPRDEDGFSTLELIRDDVSIHSYTVHPAGRNITHFQQAISDSFRPDSTFMQSLLLTRHSVDRSIRIYNFSLLDTSHGNKKSVPLPDTDSLIQTIVDQFGIPADLTREAIDGLEMTGNAWS